MELGSRLFLTSVAIPLLFPKMEVFTPGENFWGQLGVGQRIVSNRFIEIASLTKNQIVSAFAGSQHSLFLMSDRKAYVGHWENKKKCLD